MGQKGVTAPEKFEEAYQMLKRMKRVLKTCSQPRSPPSLVGCDVAGTGAGAGAGGSLRAIVAVVDAFSGSFSVDVEVIMDMSKKGSTSTPIHLGDRLRPASARCRNKQSRAGFIYDW
jgi:hypothetical protein